MNPVPTSRSRVLWLLPPLLVGILVVVFMASGRQPPARLDHPETGQRVRVVEAQAVDLVPRASGYGEVQPGKVWAAVAQVAGRVIETYPRLRNGEIVPQGTLLFRIDPVDYELQLAQAKAELAELEVQEQNAEASLAIDRRNLGLAERERERVARLRDKGTVSQSEVDSAERAVLSARTTTQNTSNTLALIPTRRRLLEARLAQAERDLANTSVSAPFNLRVAELAVERDQYVGVGQTLFRGDAVDHVEIVTQVAISQLRKLFVGKQDPIPDIGRLQAELQDFTGFRPLVRMDMGSEVAEWEAEFVRFSDQVDPQTRTIGVVVRVDDPFKKVIPGRRPPLTKGMFVQVQIRGHVQSGRVVVPRSAVRAGRVHLVDDQQRLELRPVDILFSQGPASVVADGVAPGEAIVVSDLVPAVAGMLLDPVRDEALQQRLLESAGTGR